MRARRVLVCAPRMPEFDREGGSRRTFHLLEFFQQAGWAVSFAAESAAGGERYAQTLEQRGIATYALQAPWLNGDDALVDFQDLVIAGRFDLVLLAFWNCAETYIPLVRSLSPTTTVIVDSMDIHFLRQSRRIFCDQNGNYSPGALNSSYGNEMTRELNAYAAADVVLTVSRKESELINDFLGKRWAYDIVDTEDVGASSIPFEARTGMVFIGNFRHPPNVQAIEYLCRDILPKIPAAILAQHPIYIVGNDPDETVVRWCESSNHVRLVGWVPSVVPYLQQVRISLLPLLYGAGTKRKLIQSLMAGTPSVSTPIGVEGFDIQDSRHVLVAGDATAFAAAITRLISDQALWESMAQAGQKFMRTIHSHEAVFARFTTVISEIMNQRPDRTIFSEELGLVHSSDFDVELDATTKKDALQQRRLKGFCNVSATPTEFVISSDNFREGVVSTSSASIARHRQLVCALSMALFSHPYVSLVGIADYISRKKLRVYLTDTNSVIPNLLTRDVTPGLLVCSEYFGPDHQSGEVVKGIVHQDLQRTSFDDEAFDIIITSEVFEHIPDAIVAEKEVMRILKPGGVYCCTVPFLPASEHDVVLAAMDEQGKVRHFAEPQFHDDPLRPKAGILVYRLFSFNDMKERFEGLGHEFKSYRFWSKGLGILGSDCWVHVVKKRAATVGSNV